jgi:CheY-like chemotaxis protein
MAEAQLVRLLHVEDSVADRLLVAKLLGHLKDYQFQISRATTEITAATELQKGGVDLIILDYKLPMGDGLSCIKKLRQIDSLVPIIVLSGVTTPEIGAQCVKLGADDYLSKNDLSAAKLGGSVNKALARSFTRTGLRDYCRSFASRIGVELANDLDRLIAAARQGNVSGEELLHLFDAIYAHIDHSGDLPHGAKSRRVLRPIMLDLLEGLTGFLSDPSQTPNPR